MALFFKAGDLIRFFFLYFPGNRYMYNSKLEFMIMIYDGLILKYRIS